MSKQTKGASRHRLSARFRLVKYRLKKQLSATVASIAGQLRASRTKLSRLLVSVRENCDGQARAALVIVGVLLGVYYSFVAGLFGHDIIVRYVNIIGAIICILTAFACWRSFRGVEIYIRTIVLAIAIVGLFAGRQWEANQFSTPSEAVDATSARTSQPFATATGTPDYIFLTAELLDRRFDPQEYYTERNPVMWPGSGPDYHNINALFKGDPGFPVPSSPQLLRVTIQNLGDRPIVRIWLNFPVKYVLNGGLPASKSFPSMAYSPLNPFYATFNPAGAARDRPRPDGVLLMDTSKVLTHNDSYAFDFRNVSNAVMDFAMPQSALIETPQGLENATVRSVVTGPGTIGGVSLLPNRSPFADRKLASNQKTRLQR